MTWILAHVDTLLIVIGMLVVALAVTYNGAMIARFNDTFQRIWSDRKGRW